MPEGKKRVLRVAGSDVSLPSAWLTDDDCEVTEAADPSHALALAEREQFDLIIIDNQSSSAYPYFREITERRRAEEAVRERDRLLRAIFDSISSHVAVLDGRGVITYVSRSWEEFGERNHGLPEAIGVGTSYLDVCRAAAADDPTVREALEGIEAVMAGGQPTFSVEYPCHSPAAQRWFLMHVDPMPPGPGGVVISHTDITERRRAEEAVRRSEAVLAQAGQMANFGAWEVDLSQSDELDENPHFWSNQLYRLFGYEPGSVKVSSDFFFRHVHADDRRRIDEAVRAAITVREPYSMEYRIERADGVERIVHGHAVVEVDGAGRPRRLIGALQDITERKATEEALREREKHFRATFEQAAVGVAHVSLDGRLLMMNQKLCDILGYTPEELLAKTYREITHPEDLEIVLEYERRFQAGEIETCSFEKRDVRRDGSAVWVLLTASLVRDDADGEPSYFIAIIKDISARKQAEESLKSALAEVRQLKDRLQEENVYLQEEIRVASDFGEIIGRSETLRRVLSQVEKVAPTGTTVLILGETGTGKELLAHAIHNLSPRRRHPMVKVNCATLPAQLIESELFGHERGAFTGAGTQRRGRFELADGGTIFLDEVGELPFDLQAKLLRVLEDGEFERVGGSHTISVDVHVIAATNRRLEEAVQRGTFRSDLYYRLSIYPITLPSLRERREDIPVLVRHFVKQLSVKMGRRIETIPQDAMRALKNYSWPGNIRELRNVIERAVIITQGTTLRLTDDLGSQSLDEGTHPTGPRPESTQDDYAATETLAQGEYNLILRTLKRVNWKVEGPGGAARLLDIHPSTLRTRMKKLGITRS